MLKEYFKLYLTEVRGVSEKTVAHYNTSLRTVARYLKEAGKLNGSLYDVETLPELLALQAFLMTLTDFIAQDEKGNRMYTAGLNRYIEFATDSDSILSTDNTIQKMDIPIKPRTLPQRRLVESARWNRDRIIIQQALRSARFLCEVNPAHTTFIAEASGENYIEGHHIIPMCRQNSFENSLDIYANILGVCPNCHRLLHYARQAERRSALNTIYSARAERLCHSGILLGRDDFLAMVPL